MSAELIFSEEEKEIIKKYSEQSVKDNVLSLNPFKYKDDYPKSYKKCVEYMQKKAGKEADIDDEIVVSVFAYSPRTILYEFLDGENLSININGQGSKWSYHIPEIQKEGFNEIFPSRVETEQKAFEEAFASLEEKLK